MAGKQGCCCKCKSHSGNEHFNQGLLSSLIKASCAILKVHHPENNLLGSYLFFSSVQDPVHSIIIYEGKSLGPDTDMVELSV